MNERVSNKVAQHLRKTEQNWVPKLHSEFKRRGRSDKDVHVKDEGKNFEFNNII
jgi:hypothetical protein